MNKHVLKQLIVAYSNVFTAHLAGRAIYKIKTYVYYKITTVQHRLVLSLENQSPEYLVDAGRGYSITKKKKPTTLLNRNKIKSNRKFLHIKGFKATLGVTKATTAALGVDDGSIKKNTRMQKELQSTGQVIDQKFNYFFSLLFTKLFKKQIYFINYNYFLKVKVVKFNKLARDLFYKFTYFKKTTYVYKLLKIALASLIFKDSKLLVYMIKDIFERVHYSKHKVYFRFWRYFVRFFLSRYYKKLNVYGVKLEFHGKLGVGGNSKKRSFYYAAGRCSNSTKTFKVDASSSFYRTATGVSGFTYSVYY